VEAARPLGALLLGERLRDAGAADEPFGAKAEPRDEACGRELRDVLGQTRGQRPDRIQRDRDAQGLETADPVGEQADQKRGAPSCTNA
jgi:hypothetical protein